MQTVRVLSERLLITIAVLMLLIALPARECQAADAPPAHDTWCVTTYRDLPFSSTHTTKETRDDGTIRFTCETRTLIDLLGQRQEIRESFECLTDHSLVPLSCRVETHSQSGAATVTGNVDNGELLLTFERGNARFERRIPLADKPILRPCLIDALAARAGSQGNQPFRLIDTSAWKVVTVSAERLPDADGLVRWRLNGEERSDQKGLWTLAADGTIQRAEISKSYVLKRCTPAAAEHLEHLRHEDRDLLMFAVDRNIPFPERLLSMTVQLTWKDADPAKLQLEDARQRITQESHDRNEHRVVLRLTQPATISDSPSLPLTDPALQGYLAEEDFIRPNDAAIRAQAQKWTTGASTALEAVQRLTHEVFTYLEGGELVAETLSGPEVLACRKGKCSEFTTLLASLTRSVGVPTRVALGMRLTGGRWVGHMWCEAWVGQWIPVDATADEVGGSPALLKLTDSDTVMGTQAARWAVAKSLEISILDIEQDPNLKSNLKTGIVQQSYTNADFTCRLTAPTPQWRLEDRSSPGVATIQFHAPGEFKQGEPLIHFVAFSLPGSIDASVLVNSRRTQFMSRYTNFEVLTDAPESVHSLSGRRFAFRRDNSKTDSKKIKTTEIIWTHERSGYLLNLIADEDQHDAMMGQFEAILSSFEMLSADSAEENAPAGDSAPK